MSESNQGNPPPAAESVPWTSTDPAAEAAAPLPGAPEESQRRPDMRFWLLAVAAIGIGALIFQQIELATFAVLAALFAVTHAADLDGSRRYLDQAMSWIVPVLGVIVFVSLGMAAVAGDASQATKIAGLTLASVGAVGSLATALPNVAAALARWLFRVPDPSLTFQLAARLAFLGVMIYPVAAVGFPSLLAALAEQEGDLVGRGSLWGNLIGLTLLGLGGIGFGVRRDLRASLERLGIRPLSVRHWVIVVFGVGSLILLNAGAEALQHRWFPALWERDQEVNRLITSGLDRSDALLLGLSAGVGEEVALRGALQPRLGIFMTALVFAFLHVQYSWFGVVTILMIGVVLGIIRQRTSTTVAIVVHMVYDIFAVLTFRP